MSTDESQPELISLSLFTGAGGMDIGLERAGFVPIHYLDTDRFAQDTIGINRPDWKLWDGGDVVTAAAQIGPACFGLAPGDLDLISGGPPCQPFSTAAQWAAGGRKGMTDARSVTVCALLDLVDSFLPKAVLIENVQGFVTGRASALPEITRRIAQIRTTRGVSYQLHWRVANAADYGVPQNRRRAIVVLMRDEFVWSWPEPTHTNDPITAGEALADVRDIQFPAAQGKWTELLPCIPEGWNYQWLTSRGGGEEIFGFRTRYWNFLLKLAKDQPSWTLSASPGPAAGPFHWDNRPLSTRERLRLQSFPDEWKLAGDYRAQVRLTGNATPPLLAEVYGLEVTRSLGLNQDSMAPSLLLKRSGLTEPPSPVDPLPEHFRHLVGPKPPHRGTGQGPAPRAD